MERRTFTTAAEWAILSILALAFLAFVAAYYTTGELALLAALPLVAAVFFLAYTLKPQAVEVEHGSVTLYTPFRSKRVDVAGVLAVMKTEEAFKSLGLCSGWRVSRYSFNAKCTSKFGKVEVFSTKNCSDVWLLAESPGGSRYLICCEWEDSWICESAHQSPAEGVVTTRR